MAGPLEGFRVLEIGGIGPVLVGTRPALRRHAGPAAGSGADSRVLMQELGLAAEDIDALVDQGVIADH